jgi:ubiquitin carboxyl-terminal hydrolase 5/13
MEIDEGIVMQLVSMGFDMEGCKKAVFNTNNQGVEAAMNWVLEHMGDPDFSTPFVPPQLTSSSNQSVTSDPSEDAVAVVMALGFTWEQAVKALKATGNSVERAADWVFSHTDELVAMETESEPETKSKCHDGPGKYHLHGFVSHMGTSTACGHYVCHIKKEDRWVIFNDEKVAESIAPPIGHAYLYFYQRSSN